MKGLQRRIATLLGIAILLIAGTGTLLAAHHSPLPGPRADAPATATTAANTATPTRPLVTTTAATQHPTAPAPQGSGGSAAGLAPTRAPGDGRIVSATLSIDHTNYNGVCGDTGPAFVFTLTVTVTPHITSVVEIDYQWQGNATLMQGYPTPTLLLAGDENSKSVSFPVNSFGSQGNGTDSWLAIQINYPVSLTTNQAHFSVTCTPTLASVSGSAVPLSWGGACSDHQDFLFTFAAVLAPMPAGATNVQSVSWSMTTDMPNTQETGVGVWHPYITSGTATVLYGSDGYASVGDAQFSFYLHLTNQDANGSYWVTVTVTGPNNSSVTKTVTITKSCN